MVVGGTVVDATTGIWPWIGTKPGGIAANGTRSIGFELDVDEIGRKLFARCWLIVDVWLIDVGVVIVPVGIVCCWFDDIWPAINWSVDWIDGIVAQRHELLAILSVRCPVINKRFTIGCDDVDGSVKTAADRIDDDDDAVDDDDAFDVTVYGVACTRWIWPMVGFGIFGDHTAHGKSPTKRSPTDGLASGCVCEVIFT